MLCLKFRVCFRDFFSSTGKLKNHSKSKQSISGQSLIGHKMGGLVVNLHQFLLMFLQVLVLGAKEGHTWVWVEQLWA